MKLEIEKLSIYRKTTLLLAAASIFFSCKAEISRDAPPPQSIPFRMNLTEV